MAESEEHIGALGRDQDGRVGVERALGDLAQKLLGIGRLAQDASNDGGCVDDDLSRRHGHGG